MGYGHPIHGIPMSWRLGGDGRNSRRRHSEETACKTTASEPWFSNTRVVWEFLGVKKTKGYIFLGGAIVVAGISIGLPENRVDTKDNQIFSLKFQSCGTLH